ncbi:MAG TPA: hypothetical protein PLI54_05435 [Methanoculleus sp.]|nr:hypothetical protein [Methanoculleus sp.]
MTGQNVLIIVIVALIAVAAGIMIAFAPGETVPGEKASPLDAMSALATEVAGQIDGDAMAALKPGDESTPAFAAIHDRLNAFRSQHPDIIYIYTLQRTGNAVEYVVDADYGNAGARAIGGGHQVVDPKTPLFAGFEKPSAEVYSAIYGYAPVKNGGMVCLEPEGPIAQERLEALAVEVAGQIDGDAMAALKPGDEETPAYVAIYDRLNALRAEHPEIAYAYTMRKAGNTVEYVVDADYGSDDGVAIGDGYTPTAIDGVLLRGFEKPSAEIYSLICGYAPVKSTSGAGVGMVAVEVGNPITEERLKALAVEVAGDIDGTAMAALRPGDENTPAFTAIRDDLNAFRDATPGVVYVYTMRKTGNATEYVVDADYGNGDAPAIGYTYVPTEEDAAFLAGFEGPSAEPGFYVDDWGNETATVLTGYAPIRDAVGTIVGLVGVDMGIVHES